MKEIDYAALIENAKSMINLLEYDSMRGAGKCKLNSQHLHSLYFCIPVWEEKMKAAKKAASKEK